MIEAGEEESGFINGTAYRQEAIELPYVRNTFQLFRGATCYSPVVLQDADKVFLAKGFGNRSSLLLGQRNASVVVIYTLLSIEVTSIFD